MPECAMERQKWRSFNICVTSLGHTEKNKKYLHQFYTKLVCKMGAHTYQEALAFDKKAIKPQEATKIMYEIHEIVA